MQSHTDDCSFYKQLFLILGVVITATLREDPISLIIGSEFMLSRKKAENQELEHKSESSGQGRCSVTVGAVFCGKRNLMDLHAVWAYSREGRGAQRKHGRHQGLDQSGSHAEPCPSPGHHSNPSLQGGRGHQTGCRISFLPKIPRLLDLLIPALVTS